MPYGKEADVWEGRPSGMWRGAKETTSDKHQDEGWPEAEGLLTEPDSPGGTTGKDALSCETTAFLPLSVDPWLPTTLPTVLLLAHLLKLPPPHEAPLPLCSSKLSLRPCLNLLPLAFPGRHLGLLLASGPSVFNLKYSGVSVSLPWYRR